MKYKLHIKILSIVLPVVLFSTVLLGIIASNLLEQRINKTFNKANSIILDDFMEYELHNRQEIVQKKGLQEKTLPSSTRLLRHFKKAAVVILNSEEEPVFTDAVAMDKDLALADLQLFLRDHPLSAANNSSYMTINTRHYFMNTIFFAPWKWQIFLLTDATPVHQAISRIHKWTILVCLGTIIMLVSFLYMVLQNIFIRPIRIMRHSLMGLADEGKRLTLPIHSSDELGDLAKAIEGMSGELETHRNMRINKAKELEKLVTEKTEKLADELATKTLVSEELQAKNRALRVWTELNHALSSTDNEADFLENICVIMVAHGYYKLAWIGFKEETDQGEKIIRPVAQNGFDDGYLDGVTIRWDDSEFGNGPTGRAVKTHTTIVNQDILTNEAFRPWRDSARARGYQSSIALPLIEKDNCLGALNLYSEAPNAFGGEEVALLYKVANAIAVGLLTFQAAAGQKQAEKEKQALEAKLQHAYKLEAIGTLAGGIAHDFNNILGAVLGYTSLAIDECPKDSIIRDDLDKVLTAGNRAKELVKQILAFSRQSETDKIPLQPALIIKEALKMLRPSMPSTIKIVTDIEAESGLIMADPTQINQVIINLCTNSLHAMEETGGKLVITLQETTLDAEDLCHEKNKQPGKYLKLSICDSGSGIPPEIKAKVFEPYFTTKEVGKGTGMGLSIVHGIVQSCGGFISLYSEPGTGTSFHIFFPACKSAEIIENKIDELLPKGTERILFIDDEELLAQMGKDMLERLDYQVTSRTSSLDALETFQNQPDEFDLVITDQTMPGLTGIDLARKMLQIRPDIPIILCTGYSSIISKEKARAMGIKEFLLKPVVRNELAGIIRKVLSRKHSTSTKKLR